MFKTISQFKSEYKPFPAIFCHLLPRLLPALYLPLLLHQILK